jgi:hypothetical protein
MKHPKYIFHVIIKSKEFYQFFMIFFCETAACKQKRVGKGTDIQLYHHDNYVNNTYCDINQGRYFFTLIINVV